jgi:hypothetical protein
MRTAKTKPASKRAQYVLCTNSGEYRIDLRFGRVYPVAKPHPNDPRQLIRIIDESGEDYLYPREWFIPIELPPKARRAMSAASGV